MVFQLEALGVWEGEEDVHPSLEVVVVASCHLWPREEGVEEEILRVREVEASILLGEVEGVQKA